MKKTVLLGLAVSLLLAGCVGGKSDKLGFGGDGALKTYAETFQPARDMLNAGKFDELAASLRKNDTDKEGATLTDDEFKDKLIKDNSELSLLERGLLTLNTGDFNRALLYFDAAEIKMEQEENAIAKAGSAVGKGAFAGLTGSEEATDYILRGYEKVMLYNYKALCYMLQGDRRAYNVTRRAIAKQQEEWEAFKTMLEKAQEREKSLSNENEGSKGSLEGGDTRDQYTIKKAASVPSAYVNPFGDYMNGMIMEIDSVQDASMRDNARIAYSKVLDNNKNCLAAKQAVGQLKGSGAPKGQKMVQVLLADGFSPEKKVLSSGYRFGKYSAVVNYAQATPLPSQVAGAAAGNTAMGPLSDVEALILRDDQDRAPLRNLLFTAAVLRSGAVSHFGGALGANLMSKAQKPDTRSWLSLPGKVLVARMYVPQNAKDIEIQTKTQNGRALNKIKVPLSAKGPTVIYAASYDGKLRAYANKSSWLEQ